MILQDLAWLISHFRWQSLPWVSKLLMILCHRITCGDGHQKHRFPIFALSRIRFLYLFTLPNYLSGEHALVRDRSQNHRERSRTRACSLWVNFCLLDENPYMNNAFTASLIWALVKQCYPPKCPFRRYPQPIENVIYSEFDYWKIFARLKVEPNPLY